MQHPSIDQLRQAVQIADQIQKLEAQLAAILRGSAAPAVKRRGGRPRKQPAEPKVKVARKKRGKLSAAGRANIIAAQKAR
jgi:hypothetical protein